MGDIEGLLKSEQGRKLLAEITLPSRQMVKEVAAPFVWPMSWFMQRFGELGIQDYLSGDKRMIKMFCWQIYSNLLHCLLAVAAVIVLALSINTA